MNRKGNHGEKLHDSAVGVNQHDLIAVLNLTPRARVGAQDFFGYIHEGSFKLSFMNVRLSAGFHRSNAFRVLSVTV